MSLKQSFEQFEKEALELTSLIVDSEDPEPRLLISLSLPMRYKVRFDELQVLTKKQFGKLLQKIISKSIDLVE